MNIFEQIHEHGYQQVVFCNHRASGLRAIIAIHDTTLGPALGGVRMHPFASEDEALVDVLRLARGMTYKAAISGVNLGGGKSVILGDPKTEKTEALLRAMGRFIHSLGGRYVAGQDIGTDSHDMAVLRAETPYVSCVHRKMGGAGDPSFATAWGVTAAIRAILGATTGDDSLEGRRIAIQGVGNVGHMVAKYCRQAGAELIVTDVAAEPLARVREELGAEVVAPDEIYGAECDVFSPCSIGAVLNDDTIPALRCKGIAGSANNVLAEPRHADLLRSRGIVYGPDYLVNSGGLIRCHQEVLRSRPGSAPGPGPVDDDRVLDYVGRIYDQTLQVIRTAGERGISTAAAADRMAEERIASVRDVQGL